MNRAIGAAAVLVLGGCAHGPVAPEGPVDIAVHNPGPGYRLVGRLGRPMGQMMKVQGVMVRPRSKAYADASMLMVRRLDGRATQRVLSIPAYPFFGEWGSGSMPEVEPGASYEFEGYESGGYRGTPDGVGPVSFQTSGFYFESVLAVVRGRKIETIPDGPADFVGREAQLEGTARNEGGKPWLEGPGWRVSLAGPAWSAEEIGRRAWAFGSVRESGGGFVLEHVSRRGFIALEDMVGREVELRGLSWSMNSRPTFTYRGETLAVEFAGECWWGHGDPAVLRGRLERLDSPRREDFAEKEMRFIVRAGRGEKADALLIPEEDLSGK